MQSLERAQRSLNTSLTSTSAAALGHRFAECHGYERVRRCRGSQRATGGPPQVCQASEREGTPGIAPSSLWPRQQQPFMLQSQGLASRSPSPPPSNPQAVKPSYVSAPIIMRKLQKANTLPELRHVIDTYEQQLNHIHISAAVVHYTRLHKPTPPPPASHHTSHPATATAIAPDPFLIQLLRHASNQLDSFDIRGIANTLHSLATLKHRDPYLLQRLLATAQFRLDLATPQNLANILWSAVTLGHTPEPEWMAQYYTAIELMINDYKPQDVANTLWAFGRMVYEGEQYRVSSDVVSTLLKQSYQRLHEFTPQHLANSVFGLAKLGFVPNALWAEAFLAVSQARLGSMRGEELVSTVWAARKLSLKPTQAWLDAVTEASWQWLNGLAPSELSQLVLSLGQLNAQPPTAWVTAVFSQCSAHVRAGRATPASITAVLTGFAAMLPGFAAPGGAARHGLDAHATDAWLRQQLVCAWGLMGVGVTGPQAFAATSAVTAAHDASASSPPSQQGEAQMQPQTQTQGSTGDESFILYPPPLQPSASSNGAAQQPQQQPSSQPSMLQGAHASNGAGQGRSHAHSQGPGAQHGAHGSQPASAHAAQHSSSQGATTGAHHRSTSPGTNGDGGVGHSTNGTGQQGSTQHTCQFSRKLFARFLYALTAAQVSLPPQRFQEVCGVVTHTPGLLQGLAREGGKPFCLLLIALTRVAALTVTPITTSTQQSMQGGMQAATEPAQAAQPVQPLQPGTVAAYSGRGAVLLAQLMQHVAEATWPWLRRRYKPLELALLLRTFADVAGVSQQPLSSRWMAYYWWASIVHLFSRAGAPPAALVSQIASLARLGAAPHARWWEGLMRAAAQRRREFTGPQVAALLRLMVQHGQRPNDVWVRRFLLETYRVRDELRPQDWQHILWSLAKFQAKVPRAWLGQYYRHSKRSLQTYSALQLTCVGWALSKLRSSPPIAWANKYQAITASQLGTLTTPALVRCLSGASRMLRMPQPAWLDAAAAAVRAAAAAGLQPEEERMLVAALQWLQRRAAAVAAARAAAAARGQAVTVRVLPAPQPVRLRKRGGQAAELPEQPASSSRAQPAPPASQPVLPAQAALPAAPASGVHGSQHTAVTAASPQPAAAASLPAAAASGDSDRCCKDTAKGVQATQSNGANGHASSAPSPMSDSLPRMSDSSESESDGEDTVADAAGLAAGLDLQLAMSGVSQPACELAGNVQR